MTTPVLSVIVCTYNRASLLESCLQSLLSQNADKNLFRVIVVDNNSTDSTKLIAKKYKPYFPYYSYVHETKQGLSYARNAGYLNADSEWVAYLDDDAKAFSDWISNILGFIKRHPTIKVFGGPYFPFYNSECPAWMPPEYGTNYLGSKERPLQRGSGWISGGNMILSRDLLLSVGGFRVDLGMKGANPSYGEETRLFRNLMSTGYEVYYVPNIRIDHLVAEYKMHLSWLLNSDYGSGRSSARTFSVTKTFGRHFFELIKALLKILKGFNFFEKMPLKRRLYLSFSPIYRKTGELVEYAMITMGFESIE